MCVGKSVCVCVCVHTPRRAEDIHAYGHKQQRVTHVWTMKVHLYHLNTPTCVHAGLCTQPPPARGREGRPCPSTRAYLATSTQTSFRKPLLLLGGVVDHGPVEPAGVHLLLVHGGAVPHQVAEGIVHGRPEPQRGH